LHVEIAKKESILSLNFSFKKLSNKIWLDSFIMNCSLSETLDVL